MSNGLYTPQLERDSCGTGLLARLTGEKSHHLIQDALQMLENMEHRGARGSDPSSGDGAGILIQKPHAFFKTVCNFRLPEAGNYGVATLFFPKNASQRELCRDILDHFLHDQGFHLLGYRKVPVKSEVIGKTARQVEPHIEQLFVSHPQAREGMALERKLYVLRKSAGHAIHKQLGRQWEQFYIASCSSRTLSYKGQLTTDQLKDYFPDLSHPTLQSAIALVHSRFSTNTFPKWKLAQPFRMISHNGEINTIKGNINAWRSRERTLESQVFSPEEIELLKPIQGKNHSDSASFDNVLEYLVMSGFKLPHALMAMIPEAWQHDPSMPDEKKAFYDYHRTIMEPWDGPASICFTDGALVGALLDRNGLRPSRYCVTKDDLLVVASEAGALPIEPSRIAHKGRLQPGKMLIADLEQHRIIGDEELKETICRRLPYRDWLDTEGFALPKVPNKRSRPQKPDPQFLFQQQMLFGYSREDLKTFLGPMAESGNDPVGSMGADIPLAVLSRQSQHIANYFKQNFAQVTNPPIDPIRERSVMSLFSMLGGVEKNLETIKENARFIHLESPVLTEDQLGYLKRLNSGVWKVANLDTVYSSTPRAGSLETALDRLVREAEEKTRAGANILILSDRKADAEWAPIPSLMAVGAVHHHLIEKGLRSKTSLVLETADIREVHHFATAIGYGAHAICPYLAFQSIRSLPAAISKNGRQDPAGKALTNYIKSIEKGLLKVMSKIGISTLHSYRGAQIFEALGLSGQVIKRCFRGTISRIEGLTFEDLSREILHRHQMAFEGSKEISLLPEGGIFQWKRRGESHLFSPQSLHLLQKSVRSNDYQTYKKFASLINEQVKQTITLRGLFKFKEKRAIPLEEVEPVESILHRFATGAMSFGSISYEAHTALAIAMNRIGGKSNSGEGGEDEARYETMPNGDSMRSAVKQIASGRFGVTSYYLSQADELQIKMAQGAKPGEGGQLPGHKVDEWIAKVRHSTPGVPLISPPPHHDIYSIEDLAQLIFDLKNANPVARINVKLVSKAGVGVIASGVAKAHADVILISGHDGGTGASPLTSIRHAGLPWELGLAETHQTLVRNRLRNRVTLQVDGQIRTGRDLAIATLLGAEEWGIATAALVVQGCILMRKCHLNTCPVGIATQDPALRERFAGEPEHLVNYFHFLAQDLREIMASLGYRTVNEMVGQVQHLTVRKDANHWKYENLDLSPILHKAITWEGDGPYKTRQQDHGIDKILDHILIREAQPALEELRPVRASFRIRNTDRTTGAMLSYHISRKFKGEGLPEGLIQYEFWGSAGQSFGAFSAKGLQFTLLGEANDYLGKGLSGARIIIKPDPASTFLPEEQILIGNVALYGATSGEVYLNGRGGERFAVRNSGVKALVEGVGDHGCEYMTGGEVLILGSTGKNFAAGMSGGVAWIWDELGQQTQMTNLEMVDLEIPGEEDLDHLKKWLQRHAEYTSSPRAHSILSDWDREKTRFIKVMPKAFKAALEKKQKQERRAPSKTRKTEVKL